MSLHKAEEFNRDLCDICSNPGNCCCVMCCPCIPFDHAAAVLWPCTGGCRGLGCLVYLAASAVPCLPVLLTCDLTQRLRARLGQSQQDMDAAAANVWCGCDAHVVRCPNAQVCDCVESGALECCALTRIANYMPVAEGVAGQGLYVQERPSHENSMRVRAAV